VRRRLDQRLVDQGLAPALPEARALILAGRVRVDGARVDKAGAPIAEAARLEIVPKAHPFVSRGGVKLDAALEAFRIEVAGHAALDVGASTGGFTDCLLQRGAARVYAVDTGFGALDDRLRRDPRVVLRERTNARRLDAGAVPEPIEVAAIDVSFQSAARVLPAVAARMASGGAVVVLVKPQFEAPRRDVPRGGVVRDRAVQRAAVDRVREAGAACGLEVLGILESPIRGRSGNVEIFLGFRKR
jgi:23S rRNA (cytidine1920-2'-O)/16S rRNA (cytidine1409-2'-O)-methyltransferase